MQTYITSDGDTVDYIAWKYYGNSAAQTVQQVLDANFGLADNGPTLAAGIRVELPALATPSVVQGVKLWD